MNKVTTLLKHDNNHLPGGEIYSLITLVEFTGYAILLSAIGADVFDRYKPTISVVNSDYEKPMMSDLNILGQVHEDDGLEEAIKDAEVEGQGEFVNEMEVRDS